MSDDVMQRQWFHDAAQRVAHVLRPLPGERLNALRTEALGALETLPEIARRQEAWRYTRIDSLLAQDFQPDTKDVDPGFSFGACNIEPLADAWRLVFVNGRFAPHLSSNKTLPAGVTLTPLREQLACDAEPVVRWLGALCGHGQHLFNALNGAVVGDGVFLHVRAGVQPGRPIELLFLGAEREQASLVSLRNLIVLEAGARLELVERFAGEASARYFHNGVTEIRLEQDAGLRHVRIQNEAHDTWHLGSLFLSLHHGSRYQGVPLQFGGNWSRTEYQVSFTGEDACCELDGLYTVGDGQLADVHVNVDHTIPSCNSRLNFRGLLYGRGRAVFDGCIRVGELAQHTDAQLRNDNLMLTGDAEIDTKPRLEIDADDVTCSHGTTVGQLDPQQVFYLRSRGLDERTARTLLALGFASVIVHRLEHKMLRDLADRILRGMSGAGVTST